MGDDRRTYSRADLEHAAMLVAGATSAVFMQLDPELVMPDQDVLAAVRDGLRGFDEERGGALGYSAEQLSGTRSGEDCLGREGKASLEELEAHERAAGIQQETPEAVAERRARVAEHLAAARRADLPELERLHGSPAALRRAANDGQGAH